jgi:hypothetical protein
VLEYIAYAKSPVTRAARVEANKENIYNLLNSQQREFVEYVLRNYVSIGVDELDVGKLSTVLTAKYGSIHAAQQGTGCRAGYTEDVRRFSTTIVCCLGVSVISESLMQKQQPS